MRRFRSGSETVEAVQVTEDTFNALGPNREGLAGPLYDPRRRVVLIQTREGIKAAAIGDWIVKDAQGELSLCEGDVFAATYEAISATVVTFDPFVRRRHHGI